MKKTRDEKNKLKYDYELTETGLPGICVNGCRKTRLDTGDKLVTELVEVTEIRAKRRFDPFKYFLVSWITCYY